MHQSVPVPEDFTVVEFKKIFDPNIATESLSRKFFRKLLTVVVANIAYTRFLFPVEAFHLVECDGLRFVMLKQDTDNKRAVQLITWLKSSIEAFDKGYLKEMSLCVSVNPNEPNDVFEQYKFTIGPSDFALTSPGSPSRLSLPSTTTGKLLTLKAKDLLHTLNRSLYYLEPLPRHATLTMWTKYFAHTPPEYCQPGFKVAPELTSAVVAPMLDSMKPAAVALLQTKFHKVEAAFYPKQSSIASGSDQESEIEGNSSKKFKRPATSTPASGAKKARVESPGVSNIDDYETGSGQTLDGNDDKGSSDDSDQAYGSYGGQTSDSKCSKSKPVSI